MTASQEDRPADAEAVPRAAAGAGLDAQLDRWVRAQLIAPAQARRIAEHEASSRAVPAAASPAGESRPRLSPWAETAAYLGGAISSAAGLALAAQTWTSLPEAVRLLSLAVTAAVLLVAGWWVGADTGPARRLSSLLWFLGTAATTASATLLTFDLFTDEPRTLFAVVGGVSLAVGVPLWAARRVALQAASVWLSCHVLLASGLWESASDALGPAAFLLLGLAWLAAAVVGWARPLGVCGVLGGLTAFSAATALSGDQAAVGLLGEALVVGVVLWAGRERESWPLTVAAVLGLLVLVPQSLYEVFGDDVLGATLATLLVGLVVTVWAIARLRRKRSPAGPGPVGRPDWTSTAAPAKESDRV